MILTCPECATGYFVEDGQIGPGGRKVRCAACGARWTATPEGPLELSSSSEEGAIGKPAPGAEAEEAAPLTAEDLPRAFRSRAEEDRRMRRAAASGAIWAGAAILLALAIGAAIMFRDTVVKVWPQTASAYQAIGLPVNPVGLVIVDVRADPSLQNGHAALAISGVIRNVVDRTVTAPPLRITLLNAQGKRVAGQIDALANARIPPGETRHFVTAILDPPFSASDLRVDFATDREVQTGVAASGAGPAAQPPTVTLRGPAEEPTPAFSTPANAAPATPDDGNSTATITTGPAAQ